MGGHGVGQVAGRGAADGVEAERLRVGQRHGDDAILEAQRGDADGVVLDVEIARADALAEARSRTSGVKPTGSLRLVALGDRQQRACSATCSAGPGRSLSRVKRVRAYSRS